MKRNYIIRSIILLLLVSNVHAQEELNNYLEQGAGNNPGLKAKFAEYNSALEKVPLVGTLPDPTLTFGYFVSPIETKLGPQQAQLGFSQMFPWFGTLNAKEDVAIQYAKGKYEAFEEAKSKLFFDIKSAYYNVYLVQKGIDITRENIRILNTFQQLAIIKIETGKASVVDEMRVEIEINELKNQLAYLIDNKSTIEVQFNNFLNAPIHNAVNVPDSLWADELILAKDELRAHITTQNHLVKQLDYNILSWQSQERVAGKTGLPQISVGVDYAFIGESDNPDLGSDNGRDVLLLPKVGITIPLYRKKYNAIVNEAALNVAAAEFEKAEKQNQLSTVFERGYRDYNDATRRIELFRRQLELADKSLNILLTAYSSDGENFEEILRMERKVLTYAFEYDKACADKNAAAAFIQYLIGK